MPVLDVFNGDAFTVLSLTDSINKLPHVPGRAGQVIGWQETGVATTSIMLEEYAGQLKLINPSPRGGPGATIAKEKRTARILAVPHYEIDDTIMADEVQGVREFGAEQQVKTVQGMVNRRMGEHVMLRHDPTLEYQRIGALKGIILNADGSTLYNLFTEFGVSAPGDQAFVLSPTASTGAIRGVCADVCDLIADEMGGVAFQGVYGFAGKNFWKALIAAKETRETFLNQSEARQLRGGAGYGQTLEYGDIVFERYRGRVGATSFIADDECRFFPIASPGLWRTVFAPADYVETVNTLGLPRYAKQWPMENGKGVNLETQMNALSYCTRPKTLVRGTFTTS